MPGKIVRAVPRLCVLNTRIHLSLKLGFSSFDSGGSCLDQWRYSYIEQRERGRCAAAFTGVLTPTHLRIRQREQCKRKGKSCGRRNAEAGGTSLYQVYVQP